MTNLARLKPDERRVAVEEILHSDELNKASGHHLTQLAKVTYEVMRGIGDPRTITTEVLGVAASGVHASDALIIRGAGGKLWTIPLTVLIAIEAP